LVKNQDREKAAAGVGFSPCTSLTDVGILERVGQIPVQRSMLSSAKVSAVPVSRWKGSSEKVDCGLFEAVTQNCTAQLYVRSRETKDGGRQGATVADFGEAEAAFQNRYHSM